MGEIVSSAFSRVSRACTPSLITLITVRARRLVCTSHCLNTQTTSAPPRSRCVSQPRCLARRPGRALHTPLHLCLFSLYKLFTDCDSGSCNPLSPCRCGSQPPLPGQAAEARVVQLRPGAPALLSQLGPNPANDNSAVVVAFQVRLGVCAYVCPVAFCVRGKQSKEPPLRTTTQGAPEVHTFLVLNRHLLHRPRTPLFFLTLVQIQQSSNHPPPLPSHPCS